MNIKYLLTLLAVLSLLPIASQAKSPWDKAPAAEEPTATDSTTPVEMIEPTAPQAIAAEPEAQEPVAQTPAMPEPVTPAMTETPESTATAPQPIEVIETQGDVLAMPQQAASQSDTTTLSLLDFPRRGMDQDKVQIELGAPVEIKSPVGKPPITRWIYNDRVVYFEYSTVLHVVAR